MENGFDVKHIELFDFSKFADNPEAYMKEQFSPEVAEYSIAHANIPVEQRRVKRLQEYPDILANRNPTIQDIKTYIDEGFSYG